MIFLLPNVGSAGFIDGAVNQGQGPIWTSAEAPQYVITRFNGQAGLGVAVQLYDLKLCGIKENQEIYYSRLSSTCRVPRSLSIILCTVYQFLGTYGLLRTAQFYVYYLRQFMRWPFIQTSNPTKDMFYKCIQDLRGPRQVFFPVQVFDIPVSIYDWLP